MKHDFFNDRSCVHVAIPKNVHIEMRIQLFKKQVSMQEAMTEFAAAFARGDSRAHRIIDDFVTRRLERQIEGLKSAAEELNENDKNTLYDLIESQESENVEK
jgi:hypothetical protein